MPLHLNLGSAGSVEVAAAGDLAKYLRPGIDSLINFAPSVAGSLDARIAGVPSGAVSTSLSFSFAPSWKIPAAGQSAGITLSVNPQAVCTLAILKPGDTLFSYAIGEDSQDTPVKAAANTYYVSIGLKCSLAVDAGVAWSSGNFGVSSNISNNDQFRVANYHAVPGSVTLRDAIQQAFSNFVLPFHADSIVKLPTGDYVDFEFIGKLALGFGATYGFSEMFLAGRSNGEVSASFATPVGKTVIKAAPSVQVGIGFKVQYTHADSFRVVVERTGIGATLYLLRKDVSGFSTKEDFGIKLGSGVKFRTDAATLKTETQKAAQKVFGDAAGTALGTSLAAEVDKAAKDINNSVNGLFTKVNEQKMALELAQSHTRENTALFIYNFDFSFGSNAYGVAMQGDYARALSMPGVDLNPQSFMEQLYTTSAGLNLQFFDLLQFHDITTYIQKTEILYLGARTFQIRKTAGVKTISGLFGKEREADLYFIARCKNVIEAIDISEVDVHLNAIFTDRNNASAFEESQRTMTALGLRTIANSMRAYVARNPQGTIQFTFDIDARRLGAVDSDGYLNGRPPAEPHWKDKRNYEQFVQDVSTIIELADTVSQTFQQSFPLYSDWLAFNRVVTDSQGSTKPGDRLSEGDANGDKWPDKHLPHDKSLRILVQAYILAGQAFMNFCDGIKLLNAALPGTDTEQKYAQMYEAIWNLIRNETQFPTYFLKPSMVALIKLAGLSLVIDGTLPDPSSSGAFVFELKPASAHAAAAD